MTTAVSIGGIQFKNWAGSKQVMLQFLGVVMQAISLFLFDAAEKPHLFKWKESRCFPKQISFFQPCRQDYECRVCQLAIDFVYPEATPTVQVPSVMNIEGISYDACVTNYHEHEPFKCFYPTMDTVSKLPKRFFYQHQNDWDRLLSLVESEHEFQQKETYYREHIHEAKSMLGVSQGSILLYIQSGVYMLCFRILLPRFPFLRFFSFRGIFYCCRRSEFKTAPGFQLGDIDHTSDINALLVNSDSEEDLPPASTHNTNTPPHLPAEYAPYTNGSISIPMSHAGATRPRTPGSQVGTPLNNPMSIPFMMKPGSLNVDNTYSSTIPMIINPGTPMHKALVPPGSKHANTPIISSIPNPRYIDEQNK